MGTLFETNVSLDQLMSTWSAGSGPSDEEVIKYATAMIEQLEETESQEEFARNVEQVGAWVNEVFEKMFRVTLRFGFMYLAHGKDFPALEGFKDEWVNYTMKEPNEDSTKLSQGFHELKRDINDSAKRFYAFIETTNTKCANEAVRLAGEIKILEGEIEELNGKIKKATIALAISGAFLFFIGAIVAKSVLAKYQSQRNDKAAELARKQKELDDVNRKQQALSQLKTEFDNLQPDINLICEKLVLFAEIWATVQDQSTQFAQMLKSGMEATTNMRFKAELRLARKTCGPLQAGLERYVAALMKYRKQWVPAT
ncbi:transmembrane protein, putative, partial [Rhizoctonia solani AG-3 Rhs1AP]